MFGPGHVSPYARGFSDAVALCGLLRSQGWSVYQPGVEILCLQELETEEKGVDWVGGRDGYTAR